MKNLLFVALMSVISLGAYGAGGSNAPMDHIETNIADKESLQSGLALFSNYCFGCHSMQYSRYERVANDLGIPNEIFEENLLVGGTKIGQLMDISMSSDHAKVWFGSVPPDLTLSARLRSPDWLYNYLRGFYADEKRPYGVNNVIYKDVGMPHVLAELQGVCAEAPHFGGEITVDPLSGNSLNESGCSTYSEKGSLSSGEYDQAIYDLVNFMEYVAEPSRAESEIMGRNVLIFLAFLFIFAYLLNKEYWRDIH